MRAGGLCTAGRREPCQAGNRAALSGLAGAMQVVSVRPHILLYVSSFRRTVLLSIYPKAGGFRVSGLIPQVASANLFGRCRAAAYYGYAEKRTDVGPLGARLPIYRLARDW